MRERISALDLQLSKRAPGCDLEWCSMCCNVPE